MSDVRQGDEDPGASTAMFQRFVDDGRGDPVVYAQRNRPIVLVAAAAAVLVVLLVIVVVIAVVGS
jgi:hypothetical protein